ncbi:MAG TPA: alpha/beta hydrolase [Candidatus Saccharibacteria bacterium]|nr:alpha/beta hydrolase [Candidatus Saccharibacteria bacterium]
MQIVVNGLLTNYQQSGKSGPTIVLLHGWADSQKTFDLLVNRLSSENEVITLDLPGFGQTEAPKTVWGLSDYCKFISDFLNKINVTTVDLLLGHSNGGALAIKLVASGDIVPKKLVLLSSAGIRDREKVKKLGLKVVAKSGKIATFWLPKSSKQKLQKKLYGTIGSDMLVAPELKETFKKTVSEDIQSDAKKLKLPTMIIYGDQDKATPVVYGEVFNRLIDGSSLKVIHGASHFVHQDRPDEVIGLIEGFLK